MEPIANGYLAGAPSVRARDEETPRGSELAAGLFELLARDAQLTAALAGPAAGNARAGAQRVATDATQRSRADAPHGGAASGTWEGAAARDDLDAGRDDAYARPHAASDARAASDAPAASDTHAADAGDGADAGSPAYDANRALPARGEKGTGDVGPHALAGAAGAAAGSGGSTGDSRELRMDGSTEWAAPRSPSLTATEGAGGTATGDQGALGGRSTGTAVAPQSAPAAGGTAVPAFPSLMSLEGTADPLATLTSSAALRASVRAQAVRALVSAVQARSREAILTLDPPGLGRIRIHVRVADDAVSARVSTERPEVGQMLRGDRDLIRARLAEQGLRLETLVVERGGRAIDARSASGDGARLAPGSDGRDGAARGSLHAGDAAAGDAREGNEERAAAAAAAGDGPVGASPSEDALERDTRTGVDLRV